MDRSFRAHGINGTLTLRAHRPIRERRSCPLLDAIRLTRANRMNVGETTGQIPRSCPSIALNRCLSHASPRQRRADSNPRPPGSQGWARSRVKRSGSHPRPSNRTCPLRASGSPTEFTSGRTDQHLGMSPDAGRLADRRWLDPAKGAVWLRFGPLCPDGGNTERPLPTPGLGYHDPSHGSRFVAPGAEFVPELRQPLLPPPELDPREGLAIDARRTLVGFRQVVRIGQNVFAVDLVVKQIEAVVRFVLRLAVKLPLNLTWCFHGSLPITSPWLLRKRF